MNYIWSRYNFIVEYKGVLLLYNSFTNNFYEFSEKEDKDIILNLKNSQAKTVDDELKKELINNFILVEDDDLLSQKIKLARLATRYTSTRMNLTISPTTACNFACPYCYEENAEKSNVMTEEVEDSIVSLVKSHKGLERLNVDWYGGEPLMTFEIVERLTKKLIKLPIANYKAFLITNGYLLDEKIISKLKELNIYRIQVTMDGMKVYA